MVPSMVTPVTQKKPKSMIPTLSAAAMWRARWRGSLPLVLRRSAPAVEADRIASRSARAAETGTGAGAAAEGLAADIGETPGPVAAKGAAPEDPAAGGPGGAGVVGGPRGIGGAGAPPPLGAEPTGAAPPELPPGNPPPLAPPPDAPPVEGAVAVA